MFQAAHLVQIVARGQEPPEGALFTSINSIYSIDSSCAEAVYGGAKNLEMGRHIARQQLSHITPAEELKHVLTMIILQRKLERKGDFLTHISNGIKTISERREPQQYVILDDMEPLSDLYRETVSNLRPRIMVHGAPTILKRHRTAVMIRALLLAGIRAATLWRQCGGGRLTLLLQRRSLTRTLADLASSPLS